MNRCLHTGVDVLGHCHMGVVIVYHNGNYKTVGYILRFGTTFQEAHIL